MRTEQEILKKLQPFLDEPRYREGAWNRGFMRALEWVLEAEAEG